MIPEGATWALLGVDFNNLQNCSYLGLYTRTLNPKAETANPKLLTAAWETEPPMEGAHIEPLFLG